MRRPRGKEDKIQTGVLRMLQLPRLQFHVVERTLRRGLPKCGKTLFKKKGKTGGLFCITEGCGYAADDKSSGKKDEGR